MYDVGPMSDNLRIKAQFSFGRFYYYESCMPTGHTTPITGSECLSFFLK